MLLNNLLAEYSSQFVGRLDEVASKQVSACTFQDVSQSLPLRSKSDHQPSTVIVQPGFGQFVMETHTKIATALERPNGRVRIEIYRVSNVLEMT